MSSVTGEGMGAGVEKTFAMIKSKAVRDGYVGRIMGRIFDEGFVIEHAEILILGPSQLKKFYEPHLNKSYWDDLKNSVEGPVVAMILRRKNAVNHWRGVMGATDPKKTQKGTLRELARHEPIMANNIVHGSDSLIAAYAEIKIVWPDR